MAGRKRSCFSESRHAIPTLLHRLVCLRKKECYGEHRAPRPPQAWMSGVQGPTMVYRRTVSQRQHRLALHGLRQDTAAHTGEVSPALWAGSPRGARLTAWTRAVDDGCTAWLYGLSGLCRRWSPRHNAERNIYHLIRSCESKRGTRAPRRCMAGLCYDTRHLCSLSARVQKKARL